MEIILQRIYDDKGRKGHRVLVDRLWPRGVSKERAALDGWWKDLAPSDSLRKWFLHAPQKWGEFRKRYLRELRENKELAKERLAGARGKLVLLYSAADEKHTHALVLKEYLERLLMAGSARTI